MTTREEMNEEMIEDMARADHAGQGDPPKRKKHSDDQRSHGCHRAGETFDQR